MKNEIDIDVLNKTINDIIEKAANIDKKPAWRAAFYRVMGIKILFDHMPINDIKQMQVDAIFEALETIEDYLDSAPR